MCSVRETRTRRSNALAAAAALTLAAVTAQAQVPPADPAAPQIDSAGPPVATPAPTREERAEALFQEGKRLFEAGEYAAACAKLAESDALDPTISTLGLLAGCHEREGRLATAWQEYLTTAERAARAGDSRADFARERAAALEPRLPRLQIKLERPEPGVEVLRDGVAVPAAELGKAIPVDPGVHEIVARAVDGRERRQTITARESALALVTIPAFGSPRSAAGAPGPGPKGPDAPPPEPGVSNTRRNIALITGGLGLAGVGVGIGFGLAAMAKGIEARTLQDTCRTQEQCARGEQLSGEAFSAATVSSISVGAGLAGLGASALLLLLPGGGDGGGGDERGARAVRVTPVVGAGAGGALVTGRF